MPFLGDLPLPNHGSAVDPRRFPANTTQKQTTMNAQFYVFPSRTPTYRLGMKNVFPEDQQPLQNFIDALDLKIGSRQRGPRTHECSIWTDIFSAGRENVAYELS